MIKISSNKTQISTTIKALVFSIFLISGFLIFPKSVFASCPSSYTATMSALHTSGSTPKVLPGEDITVEATNTTTLPMTVNVYVAPSSYTFEPGTSSQYLKAAFSLAVGETYKQYVTIEGSQPGNFNVRAVGLPQGCAGITKNFPLIIASTQGIKFSDSSPTSIVKTQGGDFDIIFNANDTNTFTVKVDGTTKTTGTVSGDPYTYRFHWDTSGTDAGSHTITVETGTGGSASKTVQVTDGSGAGGGGSGGGGGDGSSSDINVENIGFLDFNLVGHIHSCQNKGDLHAITCLIQVATSYLLDLAGIIAFIMILYASIIYVTSFGEESKAELAKKTLTWSIIGIIVIGASRAIVYIIINIIK